MQFIILSFQVLIADTIGAFNQAFRTVKLHRPTLLA